MNAHPYLALALPMPNVEDHCRRCQRLVTAYVFVTDGYHNATYHCPAHGDVPPMRSHIVRPEKAA